MEKNKLLEEIKKMQHEDQVNRDDLTKYLLEIINQCKEDLKGADNDKANGSNVWQFILSKYKLAEDILLKFC